MLGADCAESGPAVVIGGAVVFVPVRPALPVGPALPIPRLSRAAPMIIHLCAAVGTEHQARQRIRLAQSVRPAHDLSQLLRQMPRLFIHNGFLGILEDHPILFRRFFRPFVLVGFFIGAEINSMPHIFGPCEHIGNGGSLPDITFI